MLELRPTGLSQRIELRLPSGFCLGPCGLDPAVLLKTMQGRIERALLYLQDFTGNLLDSFANRPTMLSFDGDGFQNQEAEGPLNKIIWLSQAMTVYNTTAIVDSQRVCNRRGSQAVLADVKDFALPRPSRARYRWRCNQNTWVRRSRRLQTVLTRPTQSIYTRSASVSA